MIEEGLEKEVRTFYDKKIRSKALMTAIGYKEFYAYFDGLCTFEETIQKIKQNSRHYAKRQYTFFKHQLPVHWFPVHYEDFSLTIEEVIQFIENNKKEND